MKYTIITILAALAVVGGIALYSFSQESSQKVDSPVKVTSVKDNTNTASDKQSPSAGTPAPAAPKIDVQKLLAANPGSGATQEQLKSFSTTVSNASVDASAIDVTSCNPSPAVARVKLGKPLMFKNSDAVTHKIVNGKEIVLDIPTGSKELTPAFPGPGIFGYSCDSKIVGIFLVVP